MSIDIVFPAIVIDDNSIDKINYRYLVADKGYLSTAFKDVKIVDYEGNLFDVRNVEKESGFDLFYSIRLLGYIVRVKPVLRDQVKKMSIESLKKMLTEIVQKNPDSFSAMSDSYSLIKEIESKTLISQIVDIW